ncbi:DNA damage-repair/toleration protein DRT100-like [Oryza brachyantha]|uniref:DNA damage-repair/toleration protein DRT100-like n=1 Tax=Oryza brachyantha TaxID=4533 RepID=UPI001ADA7DAB|nr:DNA damage-repair/toleration protein DRT100-like [Oryza brachyantha]
MALPTSRRPLRFFFAVVVVLVLLGSVASSAAAVLHERDAAALRDIRAGLRDLPGSRFFESWDDATNPCDYAGVVCEPEDTGSDALRVSVLTLGTGLADSPGLAGTLPASLASLTALTDLVLYPGRVSGAIPADIGSGLRRLRLLSMSGNQLTGQIPESLAGLPDLHTLDLGNNRLDGSIPCGLLLPSSPSLKVLILANNGGLSGQIPDQFSGSQLFHVDLSRNSITGTLPPLPQTVRYFSVAGNSMQGSLDDAFGNGSAPTDLAFLDLSMNNFSGSIPRGVFALPSASSLLLSRNSFTGPLTVPAFASERAATPPWSVVDVSHNGITGAVPEDLAAVESLYVNNNRMSGEVPEAVARSVFAGRMTTFYAQHNFLTGFPVPPLPLPDSAALCLSYNCMELPSASAADGCPTIGGPLESRPADQCRSSAAADAGSSGGDG